MSTIQKKYMLLTASESEEHALVLDACGTKAMLFQLGLVQQMYLSGRLKRMKTVTTSGQSCIIAAYLFMYWEQLCVDQPVDETFIQFVVGPIMDLVCRPTGDWATYLEEENIDKFVPEYTADRPLFRMCRRETEHMVKAINLYYAKERGYNLLIALKYCIPLKTNTTSRWNRELCTNVKNNGLMDSINIWISDIHSSRHVPTTVFVSSPFSIRQDAKPFGVMEQMGHSLFMLPMRREYDTNLTPPIQMDEKEAIICVSYGLDQDIAKGYFAIATKPKFDTLNLHNTAAAYANTQIGEEEDDDDEENKQETAPVITFSNNARIHAQSLTPMQMKQTEPCTPCQMFKALKEALFGRSKVN